MKCCAEGHNQNQKQDMGKEWEKKYKDWKE